MSLFDGLGKVFTRNQAIAEMLDFDLISDASTRSYLKKMALDSVLNFVSRTMSTLQVRIRDGTEIVDSEWNYILNVRPNNDLSASDFWQRFFYKLLNDNEVLVVLSDDNQLLIADDYTRMEYALYDDVFTNVVIKDFTYNRRFPMSDVIFLQYNNEELEQFTNGLFKDYGELFGRMIEISMRNNQIRGSVSIDQTGKYDTKKDANGDTMQDRLQKYIDKMYRSFQKSSVAIVPKLNGFGYEEYTNKMGVSNQSLEELDKMKKSLINDICRMIGVPSALVHGEMADLKFNLDAYRKLCIQPLIQKLQVELINKIIGKDDFKAGKRLVIQNVLKRDPYEMATNIDKVISSGVFTPNQVLTDFEYEASDDPIMDKHYITKNYENVEEGEKVDDSENKN